MLSQFTEPEQKPGQMIAKTCLGSKPIKQQLDGLLGMPCGSIVAHLPDKVVVIGLECPLLMFNSPFTYMAKTELLLVSIPVMAFLKEADGFHPKIIQTMKGNLMQ